MADESHGHGVQFVPVLMSLAYVIDDVFLGHRAPGSHPERPERLIAIRDGLQAAGLEQRGQRLPTRAAREDELGLVHTPGYVAELIARVPGRSGTLDGDTYFSPGTWDAALAAVGAVVDISRSVLSGESRRGLAIVRPPGHHAEADRAMGFCLLNNIAIAAASLRAAGASRVAILDWDVHHGNGTQNSFYDDDSVMFLSCHQFPYYPGTGRPSEIGRGAAAGTTVNVGLPAGCGDREYAAVFTHAFAPALRRFKPDIILVSAGYDAHVADPLAGMQVTRAGYLAMARTLCALADELCEGRLVCTLEGGYDLDGLTGGVVATLDALTESPIARERARAQARAAGDPANDLDKTLNLGADQAIARTLECLGRVDALEPADASDTDTGAP